VRSTRIRAAGSSVGRLATYTSHVESGGGSFALAKAAPFGNAAHLTRPSLSIANRLGNRGPQGGPIPNCAPGPFRCGPPAPHRRRLGILVPGPGLKRTKMAHFDKDLDVRGLNCPLPILRAKKALAELASGQVLRVLATDPGSVKDFQAFAKQTGNELLSHVETDKIFTLFMKKK